MSNTIRLPPYLQLASDEEIARYEELVRKAQAVAPPLETQRHIRVITGTGNTSERKELEALCRALRKR